MWHTWTVLIYIRIPQLPLTCGNGANELSQVIRDVNFVMVRIPIVKTFLGAAHPRHIVVLSPLRHAVEFVDVVWLVGKYGPTPEISCNIWPISKSPIVIATWLSLTVFEVMVSDMVLLLTSIVYAHFTLRVIKILFFFRIPETSPTFMNREHLFRLWSTSRQLHFLLLSAMLTIPIAKTEPAAAVAIHSPYIPINRSLCSNIANQRCGSNDQGCSQRKLFPPLSSAIRTFIELPNFCESCENHVLWIFPVHWGTGLTTLSLPFLAPSIDLLRSCATGHGHGHAAIMPFKAYEANNKMITVWITLPWVSKVFSLQALSSASQDPATVDASELCCIPLKFCTSISLLSPIVSMAFDLRCVCSDN